MFCPVYPLLWRITVAKVLADIFTLREECDAVLSIAAREKMHFNPPTPRGVGLGNPAATRTSLIISILPLREEWDLPVYSG